MTDSPKTRGDAGQEPPSGTGPSLGRRRWLQAGISAAPVIMTVASRPVLAAVDCRTPSGFVSGFASGAPAGQCGGLRPSVWMSMSDYPGDYAPDHRFDQYFKPDLNAPNKNRTLSQVLNNTNAGDIAVARHCVAAMLNNANLSVPESILPLATIFGMWTEYNNGAGCYSISTSPAVCWSGSEIIEYLQSTMVP